MSGWAPSGIFVQGEGWYRQDTHLAKVTSSEMFLLSATSLSLDREIWLLS